MPGCLRESPLTSTLGRPFWQPAATALPDEEVSFGSVTGLGKNSPGQNVPAGGRPTCGGDNVAADGAAPGGAGSYYKDTRHTFSELLSALAAGGAPAGRVLDVGCAYGYLGEQLLELGYSEVWGVEPAAGGGGGG